MNHQSRRLAVAAVVATTGLTAALLAPGAVGSEPAGKQTSGRLLALNNSGVTGKATVHSVRDRLHVDLRANGLVADLPHAMHIHHGEEALHECPGLAQDANGDFRLTTAEGVPSYGPVAVSLTTKGDTSPDSALAVTRFPTAPDGMVDYERRTTVSKELARAIRRGEGVVVLHGVDYNANGTYDFDSAGASELDPNLPAEATDPAACAVLKVR